jgi:lipoate-protein ligase A
LAYDEVLLDEAEAGRTGACLRFWESPARFAVVGVGQVLANEANETNCEADGVPILRRCTAGGCVLQGPGSLNYTLVFPIAAHPEIRTLHGSYEYILGRLSEAFRWRNCDVRPRGICDLAIDGRKISGNAQRRRRNAILHHGTLIYAPDYDGMDRYLREPEDRPEYRGKRSHREFVGALPFTPEDLRSIVLDAFPDFAKTSGSSVTEDEFAEVQARARDKYASREWTYRR